MIETVLVLVITGIVIVIAVPNIVTAIQSIRLNAAAQRLVADIRYARELAISRHSVYGIQINQDSNSYQVFSLSGVTKTTIKDPYKAGNLVVSFSSAPEYSGVSISGVNACTGGICSTNDIRISAFGIPSDANNINYTSAATISLQNGSFTKTVSVNQQTGFAEIT